MNRDVTLSGIPRATGPKPETAREHLRNALQLLKGAEQLLPVAVFDALAGRLERALREIERGNP